MSAPHCVRFSVGEGWAALYVDGKLDRIGDSYLADERVAEIYGVEYRESRVMERVENRSDAPATLDELSHREAQLSDAAGKADDLEQRARLLLNEAERLRTEAGA